MILYKYRADTEFTEKLFANGKVWLSAAQGLNDPFECEIQTIDQELRRVQVAKMKEAQLAGFVMQAQGSVSTNGSFFGLSKRETRQLLQEFKSLKDPERQYRKFTLFIESKIGHPPSDPEAMFSSVSEQLASVGIFSLSAEPDNPLMWAHYAKEHRGLCVGFEIIDGSVLSDPERCLRVRYGDSTPELGDGFQTSLNVSLGPKGSVRSKVNLAFSDPSLRTAISTKGPEWAYEKEWRYVEPIEGEYDWPAPIVEVTFGLACPSHRREFYVDLARKSIPNEVRFYEIKKEYGTKTLQRVRLALVAESDGSEHYEGSLESIQKLLGRRQFSRALPMIDDLIGRGVESAELWRCKGLALGWSENHRGALECFEHAIRLDEDFFSAWYQKGVALTLLGRVDEAIEAYTKAQSLYANEHSVAFNLGTLLVSRERLTEGKQQLELAVKLGHPRAAYSLEQMRQSEAS